MLVCSISQRARRAAIAVDVAETATATDSSTLGNVVFATLVDDPTSVGEVVDAYLGQIMLEAASASETYSVGLDFTVGLDEPASAADVIELRGTATLAADVAEAASADAMPDFAAAAAGAAVRPASRAGLGSVVGSGDGKTRIISNIGAVT
jgi:hypothetical protein